MCGIWAFFKKYEKLSQAECVQLYNAYLNVQPRGPDRSEFVKVDDFMSFILGFHRLAIMDITTNGDQPFRIEHMGRTIYWICNGEIYNFHKLVSDYALDVKSKSDCEVIGLLYIKYGFDAMVRMIRSESAICLIDLDHKSKKMDMYISRDQFGVRPLYYAEDDNSICISSELKGFVVDGKLIVDTEAKQFPPGTYKHIEFYGKSISYTDVKYYSCENIKETIFSIDEAVSLIDMKFREAVKCRLESDRDLAALLSGGVDSSAVVAYAADELRKVGKRLKTFSIGMEGSTDEKYARMVAKHCDTDHCHIELDIDVFIDQIEHVVWVTETYDRTTIRATVAQYLACKWISENTNIKVLLIGDGSDELFGGYVYFHKAPSEVKYQAEIIKLLTHIHKYDGKRADRGVSSCGMEARVPFLDSEFVDAVLSIATKLRMPTEGMEKWIFRKSISHMLPKEIAFRRKEAFSDGVSGKKKSWHDSAREHASKKYDDDTYKELTLKHKHCTPETKEGLYYRELFESYFGQKSGKVIDFEWLPNAEWVGYAKDPSARTLDIYSSLHTSET